MEEIMNHILINVAIFPDPCRHVAVRALFLPPTENLNNQREKKNKSRGILRTPGLINWGKPRCQLRIKNNSLIIFYLHLSNYGFERNSKINILYNDLIAFSLAAQEILLNLAGNSSIRFWVQSILNQVSNGWAWLGCCRFRFHWPRPPLNNIFTFASWRENLWQNHATSCHKIYRRPALCSQVLSRNNRRMTSWSRVGNTDNIQHQLREN